jgi:hypothetical protein
LSLPDLRFINRKISVVDIAAALDLRVGDNGNIHCWRSELHQNGDRTASVGIRKTNNSVKCFGCGFGPIGPIDLVMSVLGLASPGDAARWVAERFDVPDLQPRKHLVQPGREIFRVGFESEIEILVRSGLWARLSAPARSIAPVLLELAERIPETQTLTLQMSYRAMARYSGITSPKAIAKALRELQEIGWLSAAAGVREPGAGPVRNTSTYLLTTKSDALLEFANAHFAQMRMTSTLNESFAQQREQSEGDALLLSKDSLPLGKRGHV